MDKVINSHIDKIEELERQVERILQQELMQLDMDAVIRNPREELAKVAENAKRIFLDEYADAAVELGFDFGRIIKKKIEQDKTIKVDDSKNPNLNDTD